MTFEEIIQRIPDHPSKSLLKSWFDLQSPEMKAGMDVIIDFTYTHGKQDSAKEILQTMEETLNVN